MFLLLVAPQIFSVGRLVLRQPVLNQHSLQCGHIAALVTRELDPEVDGLLVALHVEQRLGLVVAEAAGIAQTLVLALLVLSHVGRGLGREVAEGAVVPHVLVQRLPVLDEHAAIERKI